MELSVKGSWMALFIDEVHFHLVLRGIYWGEVCITRRKLMGSIFLGMVQARYIDEVVHFQRRDGSNQFDYP